MRAAERRGHCEVATLPAYRPLLPPCHCFHHPHFASTARCPQADDDVVHTSGTGLDTSLPPAAPASTGGKGAPHPVDPVEPAEAEESMDLGKLQQQVWPGISRHSDGDSSH